METFRKADVLFFLCRVFVIFFTKRKHVIALKDLFWPIKSQNTETLTIVFQFTTAN